MIMSISRSEECQHCRNAAKCRAGTLEPPPREMIGDCGHSDGCDSWIPDYEKGVSK